MFFPVLMELVGYKMHSADIVDEQASASWCAHPWSSCLPPSESVVVAVGAVGGINRGQ